MIPDREGLAKLLRGSPRCISMVTYEEDYALGLLRDIALETGRPMPIWCACNGLRNGLVEQVKGPDETEKPLAALQRVMHAATHSIFVMLDLVAHLRNG